MSKGENDGFAFLKEVFDNPVVKAGLGIASIALLFRYNDFADDDRVRAHSARKQVEREKVQRDHDQRSRRTRAYNAYLFNGGPGEEQVRKLGTVTVGPGDPFQDARQENTSRDGRTSFRVSSHQAGADLTGGWSNRESYGGLRLTYVDGSSWSLPTYGINGTYQYVGTKEDLKPPLKPGQSPLFNLKAAELAARLMASVVSQPATITVYRPEYFEIREQVWRDYMLANPDLAADLGWSATEEEDRARWRAEVMETARRAGRDF